MPPAWEEQLSNQKGYQVIPLPTDTSEDDFRLRLQRGEADFLLRVTESPDSDLQLWVSPTVTGPVAAATRALLNGIYMQDLLADFLPPPDDETDAANAIEVIYPYGRGEFISVTVGGAAERASMAGVWHVLCGHTNLKHIY